ncbi:MAG: hypothetical protein R2708_09965 [Vicinamibacterales bacterium]
MLAASDDGQFIYVGLGRATGIRRFDVGAGVAGPLYPLQRVGPFGTAEFARVILPGAGSPGTLVVGQSTNGTSSMSLVVYDAGVKRPDHLTDWFDSVVLVDATSLVATSGSAVYRLRLGPSGLSIVSRDFTPSAPRVVAAAGAEVFGVDGTVFDAATMGERRRIPVRVASYAPPPVPLLPVPGHGRLYSAAEGRLTTFDLTSTDILATRPLPLDAGEPRSLIALGGGLVYHTNRPTVVIVGDTTAPPPSPPPSSSGPTVRVDLPGCAPCRYGQLFRAAATIVNPTAAPVRLGSESARQHLLHGVQPVAVRRPACRGGVRAAGTHVLTLLEGRATDRLRAVADRDVPDRTGHRPPALDLVVHVPDRLHRPDATARGPAAPTGTERPRAVAPVGLGG